MGWRDRLRSWKCERQARRLLCEAFLSGEMLEGTSLKPRHGNRWILLDYEVEAGKLRRIWFGILRHPRPYVFSKQAHKVIERYLFDVEESRIRVLRGHNVTRERGDDAD